MAKSKYSEVGPLCWTSEQRFKVDSLTGNAAWRGQTLFGLSMPCLILSLIHSFMKIRISIQALDVLLRDLESQ